MAVTYATAGRPLPEWMTEGWCETFIAKWFALYPGAKRYLDDEESKARRLAIVWTTMGRVRRIPEVRSCHSYIQSAGVRQACNHGIQGDSADIMKLAMGEAQARFDVMARDYQIPTYPLMSIYDELLIETPEDHGDLVEAVLEEVMDGVLTDKETGRDAWPVPIKSDGKLMTRWTKE